MPDETLPMNTSQNDLRMHSAAHRNRVDRIETDSFRVEGIGITSLRTDRIDPTPLRVERTGTTKEGRTV
jgi:hypothetical protein